MCFLTWCITSYFPFIGLQIALRGNFLRFLSALLLALRTLGGSFSGLVIPLAWNSAISKDPEFLIGNAFLDCKQQECLHLSFKTSIYTNHYIPYYRRKIKLPVHVYFVLTKLWLYIYTKSYRQNLITLGHLWSFIADIKGLLLDFLQQQLWQFFIQPTHLPLSLHKHAILSIAMQRWVLFTV